MLHRKRIEINKLMCISARTALDSASRGTFAQSRRKGMLIRTADIDRSDPAAQLIGEKNMTGSTFRRLLPALAFTFAATVPAASHAFDVNLMLKAGFDFGGDTLTTVNLMGSGSSTKTIRANDGLYFGGGASIVPDMKELEIEVSLSYKFSGITAQNGNIDWSVLPLDALVFYRLPKFRFGGGLTYHLSPQLKGSGVASDLNAKYKDAAGLVLQADYRFTEKFAAGLRYTNVTYKADSVSPSVFASTPPMNAKTNGVGIVFTGSF